MIRSYSKPWFALLFLVACVGKIPDGPGSSDDDDDVSDADASTSPDPADAGPPGAPDATALPPVVDAAPETRAYPAGPYGTNTGDVITNLSWTGYFDDDGDGDPYDDPARMVFLEELFEGVDPDAKVILITSSAGWCGPCQDEATSLRGMYGEYGPRGVRMITAMFETTSGAAAGSDFAREWGQTFNLPFPTVADPSYQLDPYYEGSSVPMNMLVDAQTMEIIDVHHGFDAYYMRSLFDAYVD